MEDKNKCNKKKTPIEQTSYIGLLVIFIGISVAITFVMLSEYSKKYNGKLFENLTGEFVPLLIFVLSLITSISFVLYYAGKRLFRKLEIEADYEGEIKTYPSGHEPAIINFFYDGFSKTGVDITVTILDFIRRGFIKVEENKNIDDILDDNVSVKLEKVIKPEEEISLKKFEVDLMRMIFAEMGDGRNISTRAIRLEFWDNPLYGPRITKWQNLILSQIKEDDLLREKSNKILKRSIIAIVIIFILLVFINIPLWGVTICYSLIQILLAKAIFSDTNLRVFTTKGSDVYSMWMSFRKFLVMAEKNHELTYKDKIYAMSMEIGIEGKSMFRVSEKYKKKNYEKM